MKPYEIVIVAIFLIWMVAYAYIYEFKIYKFCSLMVMPFIISNLAYASLQMHGYITNTTACLLLFFTGGLIYHARNFYIKYLQGKADH
jgi:hypothetical protein